MSSGIRAAVLAALAAAFVSACGVNHPREDAGGREVRFPPPKVSVVRPVRPPRGAAPADERDGPPDPEDIPPGLAHLPDPQPRSEPPSATGNPRAYEVFGKRYTVMTSAVGYRETGLASWYGRKFQGRKTSSGEVYDMFKLTAAHKHLPLPTYVRVTNLSNGKSVIVRVNDRGPFHKNRIIDLSFAAATKLGTVGRVAMVEIETITPGQELPPPPQLVDEAAPAPTQQTWKTSAHGRQPHLLQVAAYSDPSNATTMREELQSLGIAPVVVRAGRMNNGDPVHRVMVGPFAQNQQMYETSIRIRRAGYEVIPIYE